MKARRTAALVTMLAVGLMLPVATPAAVPPVRNGDVLYSKQLIKPAARALDLYAIWPVHGYNIRLTRTPKSHELDPAARPDGRLIAYTRILLARPGSQIMRANGTHIRRLTNNWNASDRSPAFPPDGMRIVFLSNRDATAGAGNAEIWVMDTKGRHAVNLTRNPDIDDHPDWSPDGSRILFERAFGRGPTVQIYVMNADGSDQHQVGTLEGSMPTWSPDGEQIAYFSGNGVLRANADGTAVTRVARGGSAWQLAFRSGIDWRVR